MRRWKSRWPQKFDASIENSERMGALSVVGQHFRVDESSKHLTLQETRKKRQMRSGLIRQKRGLVKRMHQISIRQPRFHILHKQQHQMFEQFKKKCLQNGEIVYLIGLVEEVFVDGEHVSKLIQKDFSHRIIHYLHAQVALDVTVDVIAFHIERQLVVEDHTWWR